MTRRPLVTALVLSYNGWPLLAECLRNVTAQDWPGLDILVVDNGSTDNTAANVRREFPQARLLSLPKNIGFAAANNAGVEHSPAEYMALISNDVYLPTNFISRLVAALEADPLAAIAGPGVYNLKLNMAHYPGNGTMSLTGTIIQSAFKDPSLTFGAAGCSLVYKRNLLGPPFDPDYGFFHEEIHLAWRARLMGYRVLRLPDTVVKHIGGATVGDLSDDNRFLLERNRCLNFLTLFAPWTRLRVWPLMWLARAAERLSDRRQGRSSAPIRRARAWVRAHAGEIADKRRLLQSQRSVPDAEIVRWMSGKLTNHTGFGGWLLNLLSRGWCRLVGLKTWEGWERKQ
ncbi:MAG: glycosyltransferase family 2 protein [candidate division FCPU426 bacterium]